MRHSRTKPETDNIDWLIKCCWVSKRCFTLKSEWLIQVYFLDYLNTKTLAKLLTDRWRRLCPAIGPAGPSNPGALLKQRSKHLLRWREEGSDLGLAQDAQGGSRDWGRHGRDPSWSHRRGRICDGVFQVQLDQVLFSKFDGVYQVVATFSWSVISLQIEQMVLSHRLNTVWWGVILPTKKVSVL